MTKQFRKGDYAVFESTASLLKITPMELVNRLGYNSDAHKNWAGTGQMPYVAELACNALLAEAASKESVCVLVVRPKPSQNEAIETVLKAMGIPYHKL